MRAILLFLILTSLLFSQTHYDFQCDSLYTVYGNTRYSGKEDCDAKVNLISDGRNIIINVDVCDDVLIFNDSINSDHIEIWFGLPEAFQDISGTELNLNKFEYIIGDDKYLYQYKNQPDASAFTDEIKSPLILTGLPDLYWLKEKIDSYLLDINKAKRTKIFVFFGLTHYGIYPKSKSVHFYDRENYKYYEKYAYNKIGNLQSYIEPKITLNNSGYSATIEIRPEALGFVNKVGVNDLTFLVDIVDCDKEGEQSSLLSTSKTRKWADLATFNRINLSKPIRIKSNSCLPFTGNYKTAFLMKKIQQYVPNTYMFSQSGWISVERISENFITYDHPDEYTLPNIQRYYFIKNQLGSYHKKVGYRYFPAFLLGKYRVVMFRRNILFEKNILSTFLTDNKKAIAIIYRSSTGGEKYLKWDTSELLMLKENGEEILIGKSGYDSFIFNDSLEIDNFDLRELAKARIEIPWKDMVKIEPENSKMYVTINENEVEVTWDANAEKLSYQLIRGYNILNITK